MIESARRGGCVSRSSPLPARRVERREGLLDPQRVAHQLDRLPPQPTQVGERLVLGRNANPP
jgi:hypothetical protein